MNWREVAKDSSDINNGPIKLGCWVLLIRVMIPLRTRESNIVWCGICDCQSSSPKCACLKFHFNVFKNYYSRYLLSKLLDTTSCLLKIKFIDLFLLSLVVYVSVLSLVQSVMIASIRFLESFCKNRGYREEIY